MEVPAYVWQGLVALFGSATIYLATLTRRLKRAHVERRAPVAVELDYQSIAEKLREFIDERAEHKARNVVNEVVARVAFVERDLANLRSDVKDAVREVGERIGRLDQKFDQLLVRLASAGDSH